MVIKGNTDTRVGNGKTQGGLLNTVADVSENGTIKADPAAGVCEFHSII